MGLIEFAKQNCDELIVAVCSKITEPIAGGQRVEWMENIYFYDKKVRITWIYDELPDAPESDRIVSNIWGMYLKAVFPEVDVIIGSEKYVDYVAEVMGIQSIKYDIDRKTIPISATMVREDPIKYWDFMHPIVRQHYTKTVLIYGAESTGKTTLAKNLAEYYNTIWVPEYAREYLGERHCVYEDMEPIGEGQQRLERQSRLKANKVLFCDTDAMTTKVYSEKYYNKVPNNVLMYSALRKYDLILFTTIDVPWVKDCQRDLGHQREDMEERFKRELDMRGFSYVRINGDWDNRLEQAKKAIDEAIFKK
jgi:HTH-type transcriptional repressor of NAD biosynthesis genes